MLHAGKKKGADRGIDGIRFVQIGPNKGDLARVLISVKGGEHVSVKDIRDLRCTVERERALTGFFLTFTEPTKEMHKKATAAGVVEIPIAQTPVPKLQIFTIAELLSGRRPDLPSRGRHEGFTRFPRKGPRATNNA